VVQGYVNRVLDLPAVQDWVAGAMLERDFLPFEEPYRLAPSATQMPTGLA
jgi:glutathione S-transferase